MSIREVSYPDCGSEWCAGVEETSFWFAHRNRVISQVVRTFPPGRTVFDIGGGNGWVALHLQQSGFDTVVVEPGKQAAATARERGLKVVCSTFEDAGFRNDSIAAAGLFDVLEHIENDVDFVQRLHGCLAHGGYLYTTVPAWPALWSADDEHAGHFRRYTSASLREVLQKTGFAVRYDTYFFWILMPAVLLRRTLPHRLGGRRAITAATTAQDHAPPTGLAARVLRTGLALEWNRLTRGRRMPCGTSCIAVAQKRPVPGPDL